MAKKTFVNPFLLLTNIGDDQDTGGGSVTGNLDPVSYEKWSEMYGFADFDFDEEPGTFDDYRAWWIQNGLGLEAWKGFNGDVPLETTEP